MKRNSIGKRILVLLLAIAVLLPASAIDTQAAVGDLSDVSTGLTGNIDTADTISLPIKILDYEADGMLFEFAEAYAGVSGVAAAKTAGDFGSSHYYDFTALTSTTTKVDNNGKSYEALTDVSVIDYWTDVNIAIKTGGYANYARITWAENSASDWRNSNAAVLLTDFTKEIKMNSIRYVVLVYRTSVEDTLQLCINNASTGGAGATGHQAKFTMTEAGASSDGSTANWTYAVYDLKNGGITDWTTTTGIYAALPIDASGEYIDLAHVAYFSNEAQATAFGEYALTDGSDRGDNRGFGLLRSSRNQSGGNNYAGIIDETTTVEQLNTYGDTTSIDFSTLTTLGYTLLGTFSNKGIANVGLLESGLSKEGYPVYKQEVVTYVANLLKHSLKIPERTSDGWKNYRYVKGTASSVYGNTDLATALRAKINGTMGSYAAASGKNLVGTWAEVGGNIASYYDAAYFLLNSIFVSGSYNVEQDDYDYLVLSAGTDSNTGDKVYVFDGGFTTSSTPASASMAIDYNATNHTIQNTSAAGKTHFVYEGTSTTTLNPFPPVTDRNTEDGMTKNPYYQDDGVINGVKKQTTKDTLYKRNFGFAMVSEGEFVYHADDELFFDFEGDDDVYLFINNELVMDIGSAHSIDGVRFELNDYVNAAKAGNLGSDARNKALALEEGNTYSFKFYYMERHSYGSNIRISTNIKVTDPSMTTTKTAWQNSSQLDFGSIVDPKQVVEYGFAITNNGEENLYNLTFTDNDIGVTLDPTNGLTVRGSRVYDVNGETLEVSDLTAIVSNPGHDDITITFANNDALKSFLKTFTSGSVQESGSGLWKDGTVLIRGIGYQLTDAQIAAGVFDNTVFTTSTNFTGSKKLQGQASMRVFVPADPMYYEWAGHNLSVTKTKLVTDVLAAANQTDNILNGKVPNLTTNNVNKIELVTKAGTAISSSNVTIDSNYNLTINYPTTGSKVFYVKITYNSSNNTVIVPVLVNVTDVKDSVYVLDYGLSVDLTANGELTKNDTLTVPGRSTKSSVLAIGKDGAYSPNEITFTSQNEVTATDGKFSYTDESVKYTPTDFMDEIDTVQVAVNVYESDITPSKITGTLDINNEVEMYKNVNTLPATVVYYEDDFPAIQYANEDGSTTTNVFKTIGSSSDLKQSVDQEQEYGQDDVYSVNTDKSGGTLTTITIKQSGKVASFTFKGTGFELVGRTNAKDSATLIVKVKDNTGATVKTIPVITEYDNDANGGDEEIYQVPVIRVDGLELGTYTVEISGVPARDYDNLDADGNPTIIPTYLYIDGLRIYQPLGTENENYTDEENGAEFKEIRDLIVNGEVAVAEYDGENMKVSTGTTTWTENRNGVDSTGNKFEGNQVDSVSDYLTLGPNNEVYMNGSVDDAALVFYVEETGDGAHNLQIAVHGVDGGAFIAGESTGIEAAISYGTKTDGKYGWTKLSTVESATEQYYTIDYTKCPYVEGKGYQVAIKVDEESNNVPAMVAYTSLKINGLEIISVGGEATTLYYDNGILTDANTGLAVASEEYPVFYSLRAQMVEEDSAVEEETTEEETDGDTEEGTTDESTPEDSEVEDETTVPSGKDDGKNNPGNKDNNGKGESGNNGKGESNKNGNSWKDSADKIFNRITKNFSR